MLGPAWRGSNWRCSICVLEKWTTRAKRCNRCPPISIRRLACARAHLRCWPASVRRTRNDGGTTNRQGSLGVSVKAISKTAMLGRRSALLAPLALGGCSWFDDWFGDKKTALPGKRESVFVDRRGLVVDDNAGKVVLPPAVRNADWPQAGGNPSHLMGHLEANDHLAEAWKVSIGEGGGYRQVIMAQPVVQNGVAFTMDSDAVG